MASSQLHFNILLDLASIVRRHFVVDFETSVFEGIIREPLGSVQSDSIVPVELLI